MENGDHRESPLTPVGSRVDDETDIHSLQNAIKSIQDLPTSLPLALALGSLRDTITALSQRKRHHEMHKAVKKSLLLMLRSRMREIRSHAVRLDQGSTCGCCHNSLTKSALHATACVLMPDHQLLCHHCYTKYMMNK
jgi:hypothetical protein